LFVVAVRAKLETLLEIFFSGFFEGKEKEKKLITYSRKSDLIVGDGVFLKGARANRSKNNRRAEARNSSVQPARSLRSSRSRCDNEPDHKFSFFRLVVISSSPPHEVPIP